MRVVRDVREGLEPRRVFSPLVAWALCIGCTVGWASFVMPATTYLPKAGPAGTAIAFAFGMLAMLVIAVNYGYMARCCPDEGGVYAYARREFGPNHAFICSWCLVLAYCSAMVSNTTALALVIRSVFGGLLQVGPHYVVAGYDVYLGEVASSLVVTVLAALACIRGTRLTGMLETVFSLGMVGGVVVIAALALVSPATRPEALRPLFSPGSTPLVGTLAVVAQVPWAFIGFEAVSQVSGECSFPRERFLSIMVVAVVIGALMYLTLNTVTAAVVPDRYASWAAYLDDLPNLRDVAAIPSFQAGYHLAGRAGVALFGVTALCAVLSGVVGFYLAVTRLVHVMAVDGALNRRFAGLHERRRTPVVPTLAILAVALVVPFFGRNVLTWIVDLMSLGALIAYLYTSLTTLRQASREGNRLMRAMGVLGVVVSGLCIALLVVPMPWLGTALSRESYIILVAWVALGVNFFTPTVMR